VKEHGLVKNLVSLFFITSTAWQVQPKRLVSLQQNIREIFFAFVLETYEHAASKFIAGYRLNARF
jgi:hypothetical protein